MDEANPAVCLTCPRCKSRDVRRTLATGFGAYCLCQRCGHIWHDDSAPPPASGTDA